jgi:hypothetical protein
LFVKVRAESVISVGAAALLDMPALLDELPPRTNVDVCMRCVSARPRIPYKHRPTDFQVMSLLPYWFHCHIDATSKSCSLCIHSGENELHMSSQFEILNLSEASVICWCREIIDTTQKSGRWSHKTTRKRSSAAHAQDRQAHIQL